MKVLKYNFYIEVKGEIELIDKEVEEIARKAMSDKLPIIDEDMKETISDSIKFEIPNKHIEIKFINENAEIIEVE